MYTEDFANFRERKWHITEIYDIADKSLDVFDKAIKETTDQFLAKLKSLEEENIELRKKLSSIDSEEGKMSAEEGEIFGDIDINQYEYYWTLEQLSALAEMRVVNLFKNVEINMKLLIQRGFVKINTKDFWKWESFDAFFTNKDIPFSKIEGYQETLELKKVNNSIKHSHELSDEVRKISEFKGEVEFTYHNIDLFLSRIRPRILKFIEGLASAIVDHLYVFDEHRISNIVEDYSFRMDVETLKELGEKIKGTIDRLEEDPLKD
jgi:hypothetical protein